MPRTRQELQDAAIREREQREFLEERIGNYNSLPPNVERIFLSEYLWRMQVGSGSNHAFKQVLLPSVGFGGMPKDLGSKKAWCSVYLKYGGDYSGIGMIVHYNGVATRAEQDAYFAEYFKFHYCDHDYETLQQRMCYWQGKCRKCGYVSSIDSSG